jgi:tetratricopeptide (TPR) repeat protein
MKKCTFTLSSVAHRLLRISIFAGAALLLGTPLSFASPRPPAAEAPRAAAHASVQGDPRSLELNEKAVAALNAGRFSQAEELFQQALSADPRNLTAAFNLAGILLNNSKIPEAVSLLESYTKEYQQDPGLYSRLGDAYFANKQVKEAAATYEKALHLDQNYPNLPTRLATSYGLLNRSQDAEKFMKIAVDQNPKDFKTLASYSSLLLGNGKAEDAIGAAKRSLQIKPSSEAYITLGTAYEIKGDFKNSLISFQRAADLGDTRKELKEKIALLEKRAKA